VGGIGGVVIAVFIHHEESTLDALFEDLCRQTIVTLRPHLHLVLNGSSDASREIVRRSGSALSEGYKVQVHDWEEKGKSRSWRRFVTECSADDDAVVLFLDADIRLTEPTALHQLKTELEKSSGALVVSSRPLKTFPRRTPGVASIVPSLIARLAGSAHDASTAVCGQLYALRVSTAKNIPMPVGLPVEDGYIRAMVLTGNFSMPEDTTRAAQAQSVSHYYASENTLVGVFRHQLRIVVGGGMNSALFSYFRKHGSVRASRDFFALGGDGDWLASVLHEELPTRYGWVPPEFVTGRWEVRNRSVYLLLLASLYDLAVYACAQWVMARRRGIDYW
jgi:glycosyltransferase involved in cell wall biosynthesis